MEQWIQLILTQTFIHGSLSASTETHLPTLDWENKQINEPTKPLYGPMDGDPDIFQYIHMILPLKMLDKPMISSFLCKQFIHVKGTICKIFSPQEGAVSNNNKA